MKRFIFKVPIEGSLTYGIYAKSEEEARQLLVIGGYDSDNLIADDTQEDCEHAELKYIKEW